MATGITRTSFEFMMKELYPDDEVERLYLQDNPLIALVDKTTRGFGRYIDQPVIYGTGMRRSATFSVAQAAAAANATKGVAFHMTPVKDYALATIDGITLKTANSDETSFARAVKMEVDSVITELKNSLGRDIYRSGWGSLAVISAISSATITLTNASDAYFFEPGLICVFAGSESAAALRNSGAGLTVLSVDTDAGTVTFTAAVSTETGTAVGDFIFTKGDRENSVTPTRAKITGLEGWLPLVAPSASENFFSVDRSVHASRLAGLRWSPVGGTPIHQILVRAASKVMQAGGRLTHFMVNPDVYTSLELSLDTKVNYVDVKGANFGFQTIALNTPAGEVKVVSDRNCPRNRVFGLDISTWTIYSGGPLVMPLDEDGIGSMLRQSADDGYEIRYGYYAQLGCSAPGRNIVIALSD